MDDRNFASRDETDSMDRLLSILSFEYNRHALHYFVDSSEITASLEELADYVATQCESDADSPDHVATRLHHSGLPKLADAGVLDYDRRQNTVRYRGHPLVEEHWDRIVETDVET